MAPDVRADMAASDTSALGGRLSGGTTVSVAVATAIVVADMVGVGVFTSLGFQVKDIPSGFAILVLWTVGGIVALCGVFSYSELGAMFPRSSGEYNFLSRAYHPAFGFVAGFVSATASASDRYRTAPAVSPPPEPPAHRPPESPPPSHPCASPAHTETPHAPKPQQKEPQ